MDIVLSEIHQTQQDKYCMISLTCGIEKIQQKKKKKEKEKVQQTSEYKGKEADSQIQRMNEWLREGRGEAEG